jgi:hypothetical protein
LWVTVIKKLWEVMTVTNMFSYRRKLAKIWVMC